MNSNSNNSPADSQSENFRCFVDWLLKELGVALQEDSSGVVSATLPPAENNTTKETYQFRFTQSQEGSNNNSNIEQMTLQHKLLRHALAAYQSKNTMSVAAPIDQPQGLHQLAEALFAPFEINQGKTQLGGCQLEDRPVLRITTLSQDNSEPCCSHDYFWENGKKLSDTEIEWLGVQQLETATLQPTREQQSQTTQLQQLYTQLQSGSDAKQTTIGTIIWCKYVTGKIDLCIDEGCVSVPFSGWGRALVKGLQSPPPYRCPYTQYESYQIEAADDGKISVAKGIETCQLSQKRVLTTELKTCSITGQRIHEALLLSCATSGDYLLPELAVTCDLCQQQVSPQQVRSKRCLVCRSLKSIRKDDPRMARVLDIYPRFDLWNSWKIAESPTLYILVARSWFEKMLLVVDKDNLEAKRIATKSRWIGRWEDLPEVQYRQMLEP